MYSKLSSLLMTPVMASCQRLSKLESLLYIAALIILFTQLKNAVKSGGNSAQARAPPHQPSARARNCISCSLPPAQALGNASTMSASGYQCGPNSGPRFHVATAPTVLRTSPMAQPTRACCIGRLGAVIVSWANLGARLHRDPGAVDAI